LGKKKKEKILFPENFSIDSKGFKCFFGERKTFSRPFLP